MKINVKGLQVSLADVFVAQLGSASRTLPIEKLSIHEILGDAAVFHPNQVSKPAQSSPLPKQYILGILVRSKIAVFVTLSCHVMPSILLRQRRWKLLSLCSCLALRVHVSLP